MWRPRSRFERRWDNYGRHAFLFLATATSIYVCGEYLWGGGWSLLIGISAIMLAHEMGHYLMCRYYWVDASLPYFLPFPIPQLSLFGTFGAFIRIRGSIPHRRALFDIGVAGPLAGFVVSTMVLFVALHDVRPIAPGPDGQAGVFRYPLAFTLMYDFVASPIPSGMAAGLGPLAVAAWFGFFLTALNLIPIGQLDGGHMMYALFRGNAHFVSRVVWWLSLALVYFGPNWLIWATLASFLGRRHPPTLDDAAPVGGGRFVVGFLTLAVFALCFMPSPIVWSWSQAAAEIRELLT